MGQSSPSRSLVSNVLHIFEGGAMLYHTHMEAGESLPELLLSFSYVGPGSHIQAIRLGGTEPSPRPEH